MNWTKKIGTCTDCEVKDSCTKLAKDTKDYSGACEKLNELLKIKSSIKEKSFFVFEHKSLTILKRKHF